MLNVGIQVAARAAFKLDLILELLRDDQSGFTCNDLLDDSVVGFKYR